MLSLMSVCPVSVCLQGVLFGFQQFEYDMSRWKFFCLFVSFGI